jgi:hypothetical protein
MVQIFSDLESWRGYRDKEAQLNPSAPKPSGLWSGRLEYLRMIFAALVGAAAYVSLE